MAKMTAKTQRELYLFTIKHRDEVTQWVQWDAQAKAKMATYTLTKRCEVHHLAGRGKSIGYHFFCNLINSGPAAHWYAHSCHPAMFDLACLRSKMASEQQRLEAGESLPDDESKWLWHPVLLAKLYGRASLSGRVWELMHREGVEGTVFYRYGEELIAFLDP